MKLFAVAALASCALVQGLPLNMYTKRAFVEVGQNAVCNQDEVEAFHELIKKDKCPDFPKEKKCTVEGDEDPSEDCGLLYELLKEQANGKEICKGPNIGQEKENRICFATAQEAAAAEEAEGEAKAAKEKKGAVIAIKVGTAEKSMCKLQEPKEASEVKESHCGPLGKIVEHVKGEGKIEECVKEVCEGGTPEICPLDGCSSDKEKLGFIHFIGIFGGEGGTGEPTEMTTGETSRENIEENGQRDEDQSTRTSTPDTPSETTPTEE